MGLVCKPTHLDNDEKDERSLLQCKNRNSVSKNANLYLCQMSESVGVGMGITDSVGSPNG